MMTAANQNATYDGTANTDPGGESRRSDLLGAETPLPLVLREYELR